MTLRIAMKIQLKKTGNTYRLIIPFAQAHHTGLWEVIGRNLAGLVLGRSEINVRRFSRAHAISDQQREVHPLRDAQYHRDQSASSGEEAPQFSKLFCDQYALCGDDVQFECTVTGIPTPDVSGGESINTYLFFCATSLQFLSSELKRDSEGHNDLIFPFSFV